MGKDKSPEKVISDQITKTKKRVKKVCCCGTSWFLLGLVVFIVGIALLVAFSKYWGDNTEWKRGLAYTGVVFVLLGVIMVAVGITFCVALYIIWKRLNRGDFAKAQFKPPLHNHGMAPYPQQPSTSPVYTQVSSTEPQPSAPPSEVKTPPPADHGAVQVEISEHHKF